MTINERSFILDIVRYKDDKKHRAICDAAIGLITANGFADTSISKIAKAAGVSPATIYVYFENKEDLLNQLYLMIKEEKSIEMLRNLNGNLSIKEAFEKVLRNFYDYALRQPVHFSFGEQFANSPLVGRISKDQGMSFYQPLFDLFERGKRERIFKDIPLEIFSAFTFSPLMGLIKEHFSGEFTLDKKALETALEIAWDAVTNSEQ
ncbi:MAG: TetR/AcrR family transcriptional regulator [Pyrinomonadaceae bacterium]